MIFLIFLVSLCILLFFIYKKTDTYTNIKSTSPLLDKSFYNNQNSISFYFFSSPFGINWESPSTLFFSSVKNALSPFNRIIGHVAIEVRSKDNQYYEFTSMTDTKKDLYKRLVIDQIGFGLALANYPGRLETKNQLLTETSKKFSSGRVQIVSYLINDSSLERFKKYLAEYKEKGQDKKYSGLDKNPRFEEGAGCAPFCFSVSEILGLNNHISQKDWLRSIYIPQNIVGPPHQKKKVSLWKMFNSPSFQKWANKKEAITITFWDLDKIFHMIKDNAKKFLIKSNEVKIAKPLKIRKIQKTYELLYDTTNLDTPTEPIWLKRENSI